MSEEAYRVKHCERMNVRHVSQTHISSRGRSVSGIIRAGGVGDGDVSG